MGKKMKHSTITNMNTNAHRTKITHRLLCSLTVTRIGVHVCFFIRFLSLKLRLNVVCIAGRKKEREKNERTEKKRVCNMNASANVSAQLKSSYFFLNLCFSFFPVHNDSIHSFILRNEFFFIHQLSLRQ